MTVRNPFLLRAKVEIGKSVALEFLSPTRNQKVRARELRDSITRQYEEELKEAETTDGLSKDTRALGLALEDDLEAFLADLLVGATVEDAKLPPKWKEVVKDAGHLRGATGWRILNEVCFRDWAGAAVAIV